MVTKCIGKVFLISDSAIDHNEDNSKITIVGMIIDPKYRMVNNNII